MEREPKAWRSLFPWGQRVNLPAMVVKRPRLHVLVVGTGFGSENRRTNPRWEREGSTLRCVTFSPSPTARVPCRSSQSLEGTARIGAFPPVAYWPGILPCPGLQARPTLTRPGDRGEVRRCGILSIPRESPPLAGSRSVLAIRATALRPEDRHPAASSQKGSRGMPLPGAALAGLLRGSRWPPQDRVTRARSRFPGAEFAFLSLFPLLSLPLSSPLTVYTIPHRLRLGLQLKIENHEGRVTPGREQRRTGSHLALDGGGTDPGSPLTAQIQGAPRP